MEIEFSYGERISILKFYPIVILFWVEENGEKKKKKKDRNANTRSNYEIFRGISCNSSVNVTANLFYECDIGINDDKNKIEKKKKIGNKFARVI